VRPKCSRGLAEVQPRCGRGAAEVRPRCSQDLDGVYGRGLAPTIGRVSVLASAVLPCACVQAPRRGLCGGRSRQRWVLRSLFDRLHDRRRPDGGLAVPVEEEHDADGHDVGEEDDDRVRGGDCDLVQRARARARAFVP